MQYERVFRVRHCECDAFDRVSHANYLRYIQETAMDASAHAGFDGNWYSSNGFVWFVRDTTVNFIEPLRYGDSVRVGTRVRNMRQALSRRVYELRRTRDDALVATAETDWAFIDAVTGKPARIPQHMREAFFPNGDPPDEPRERFPIPPCQPPRAFHHRRKVEWRDIDPAYHVNNSVYLAYSEDCAMEALQSYGWSPARMRDAGFSLDIRTCRLEYKVPAVLSDELTVTTWFSDVSEDSAMAHVSLGRAKDNILLSRARLNVASRDVKTGECRVFDASLYESLMQCACENTSQ